MGLERVEQSGTVSEGRSANGGGGCRSPSPKSRGATARDAVGEVPKLADDNGDLDRGHDSSSEDGARPNAHAQQQQQQPTAGHRQGQQLLRVHMQPELANVLALQHQQQQQQAVVAAHLNAQQHLLHVPVTTSMTVDPSSAAAVVQAQAQAQAAQHAMQLAPFVGVHNLIPLHLQGSQHGTIQVAAAGGVAGGVAGPYGVYQGGVGVQTHNLIPGHLQAQVLQGGAGIVAGGIVQQQPALVAADPRQYPAATAAQQLGFQHQAAAGIAAAQAALVSQQQQQAGVVQQIQQIQMQQQQQQTLLQSIVPTAPSPGLPPGLPHNPATGLPFLTVQDMAAALGPHVAPSYNGVDSSYPGLRLLNANPPVYGVDDFLTPTECDFLIKAAEDAFGPAPVVGRGVGEVSPSRTSSTCYLAREDFPAYLDKVTRLTGKPREHCELPQVGRYLPSQQYLQHFDAFDLSNEDGRRFAANGGQRTVTVLVYLNDVHTGGATHFPALNLQVRPRRGMAIVFFPATVDGMLDKMALHAALPAVDTKFVSQVWIRQGNYDGLPSKRIFPSEEVARQAAAALQQQGTSMDQ